jgi:hypothetical protein
MSAVTRDGAPNRGGAHVADQPTRPSSETHAAEARDARTASGADREATPDEAAIADEHEVDPDVAEHEREMAERGANQRGEGRLP